MITFDGGLNDFFLHYYMAIILWEKLGYTVLVVGDERRFWRGQRSVSSFWNDSGLRDHFRLRNSVQCVYNLAPACTCTKDQTANDKYILATKSPLTATSFRGWAVHALFLCPPPSMALALASFFLPFFLLV